MKYHQYITLALTLAIMPVMGEPIDRAVTDSQGRTLHGTILGRKGETIRFRRQSDGKEFAINMNSLSPKDYEYLSTLPEGSYDKPTAGGKVAEGKKLETINTPDKVFLALPFDKQDRGGICTAAALLNVLQFMDPTLKMDQEEMFTLFGSGRSGANYDEMEAGIRSLGYKSEHIQLDGQHDGITIKDIQKSLSANLPVLAATSNHMVTVIGFDISNPAKKTIGVWDQKQVKRNALDENGLGINHMEEQEFLKKFKSVILLTPNPKRGEAIQKDKMLEAIQEKLYPNMVEYTLAPTTARIDLEKYLEDTLVTRINIESQRNHKVFLKRGNLEYEEILKIPNQNKRNGTWVVKPVNKGTEREVSQIEMIQRFRKNDGVFYASPPTTILPR